MDNAELLGLGISRHARNYSVRVKGIDDAQMEKAGWKRTLSTLVNDHVILDAKAGNELIARDGDVVLYSVVHLWRFRQAISEISERSRIYCDITVLNQGVISTTKFGELFLTYGHDHTRRFGEIYSVLAGEGTLMMYLPGSNATRAVEMRTGDEHYIPPGWVHRFYCGREGVVLAGFVPYEAGHRYETVKGKGFPYHLFYDEGSQEFSYMKNQRFPGGGLDLSEAAKGSSWVPKFFGATMELRRQLEKEV